MANTQLIVTFTCQKDVFVYNENCYVKPMAPFKTHESIEQAKTCQKEKWGKDIQVKIVK